MVKLTFKRAAASPDDTKWICESVDGVPELKPPEEEAFGPSESTPAEDENLAEDPENWRQTVPMYLEVEMHEVEDGQLFPGSSAVNNANALETQHPTYSQGTTHSAGNSCSDSVNLSGSHSKQQPQRDVQNASNQSPTGAHSSKSKVPENFYHDFRTPGLTGSTTGEHSSKSKSLEDIYDFHDTPSLIGGDGIVQAEAAPHFPRAVWSQNTSTSSNQGSMNSGDPLPSTSQNLSMNIHKNSPYASGFLNSEKPEVIAKGDIPNHLQQEIPNLKTNHRHSSARDYVCSSTAPNSHAERYNWPWVPVSNAISLPIRSEFAARMPGISGPIQQASTNYPKQPSQTAPACSNVSPESVHPPKRKKSFPVVAGMTQCDVCNMTFKSSKSYRKHILSERHLKKVGQTGEGNRQSNSAINFQPNLSQCGPIRPAFIRAQLPQQHPYFSMFYQMQHQQMLLTLATAAANQSAIINNAYVPNPLPETSKSDRNEEFIRQNRMKLPVNHTSNTQNNFLLPRGPQSENSKVANPNYLENKAPEPSRHHGDPSQIQPRNFSVSMSEPHVKKPKLNESADGKTIVKDACAQNYHQRMPKSDYNKASLDQNRFGNGLETKCYPEDPRHQKLPVNHTSNPHSDFLLPKHSQPENSKFANPKYLENKAPESSHHENPSQIQPGNFSVSMSEQPCVKKAKSKQPENWIASGSLQTSQGVSPASCHQPEFFRIYICVICSKFYTNDLQELERHISIDRRKTPPTMISFHGGDLWCKLCDFKTPSFAGMDPHLSSTKHLNRVDYYNHVKEGDFCTKEKLENLHQFTPVFLFCAACEFSTASIDNLKIHSVHPSHQHNVSCCMYLSKCNSPVEYCYCRPCKLKTLTKRDLLLHTRSEDHMNTLRQYPSHETMLYDPAQLFFIKEISLNIKKAARVSEHTEGSAFIEGENLEMRKEKNDFTENPAPLDLSLKPLSVSCSLCQQVLPEINDLVQHFQRVHGVNESGVKWLISNIEVGEEESLPSEKLSPGKPKDIAFSPQKYPTTDKLLPTQGMDIDFPSQSSVVAEQNLENKPSTRPKGIASEQSMAMVENLNHDVRTHEYLSSSPQLTRPNSPMQNPDRKTEGITDKYISSSEQIRETECMQNPGRSSKVSSTSQEFYEKEEMWKSSEPYQNLNFYEERENIDPPQSQQFPTTKYTPPIEEENATNSDENLNSSSSQAEVIVEFTSDPIADGKSETLTDDSFSEHFPDIEGLQTLQLGFEAKRKRGNSSSSSFNPPSKKQFCKTESALPLGEEKVSNSRENLNSSSSQTKVIGKYESEPNGKNETEAEDFIKEHFSGNEYESPASPSYPKASREKKSDSRDRNSVTSEQFPAIDDSPVEPASPTYNSSVAFTSPKYDSLIAPTSPTYEQLPAIGNSSVAEASPISHNNREKCDSSLIDLSGTPEQLLSLYDFINGLTSPISQSVLKASRKLYDSSSSDLSPIKNDSFSDEHGSPIPQLDLNASKERNDSSSSNLSPITNDSFSDEHGSPLPQLYLNASKEGKNSSSSDNNSATHERSPLTDNSASEHFLASKSESPKPQSGLTIVGENHNSSSSDDILIEYEWLPTRAERSQVNSSPTQHNLLDSENKSPLEDEQNLNSGEDVVNDPPISRPTTLAESTQQADTSIINTNAGNSRNDQIVLYDCPNEPEAEFTAPNSPVASDLQLQAWRDIENIEIKEVFSLNGCAESSNVAEEGESSHFETVFLSDPEDS